MKQNAKHPDVHADGSIELTQSWRPGGAQVPEQPKFVVGEQYLFAIREDGDTWQIVSVQAVDSGDEYVDFRLTNGEQQWCEWDWSEVEWWCPVADLHLPYIE